MAYFRVIAIFFFLMAALCQGTPTKSSATHSLLARDAHYCQKMDESDGMTNQTNVWRSPMIEDCSLLALGLTRDFTLTLNSESYILGSKDTCHFSAMGAASVNGPNVRVTIGAADIAATIDDAIDYYATYGRVGAFGTFHCRQVGAPDNSGPYMFQVGWAIS